jgi:hypothetical protein
MVSPKFPARGRIRYPRLNEYGVPEIPGPMTDPRQDTISELMSSIETSLQTENWYAALAIALMLPDICASCDPNYADMTTGKRYGRWFDLYLAQDSDIMINGELCWDIRCKFLHQASSIPKRSHRLDLDVGCDDSQTEVNIDMIRFTADRDIFAHGNLITSQLQLSVAVFCRSIMRAVVKWLVQSRTNPVIQREINSMAKIEPATKLLTNITMIR